MQRIDRIEQRLREHLAPLQLEIQDDSARHAGHAGARDGRGHFNALIVSESFAGISTVRRHRLVYAALGDMMTTDIHALSIRAFSPDEATRAL